MSEVESQLETINSNIQVFLAFNFTNEKYSSYWSEGLLKDIHRIVSKIRNILLHPTGILKRKFFVEDKSLSEFIGKLPSKKDARPLESGIEDTHTRKKEFKSLLQKISDDAITISEIIQNNRIGNMDEVDLLFVLENINNLFENILNKIQKQSDKVPKTLCIEPKETFIDASVIIEKELDKNQSNDYNEEEIQFNKYTKKLKIGEKKKMRTEKEKIKEEKKEEREKRKEEKREKKRLEFKERYNNKTLVIQNIEHSDYINSLFAQFDQKLNGIKEELSEQKMINQRTEKTLEKHKKKLRKHKEKLDIIENYFELRETTSFFEDRLCRKHIGNKQCKKDKKTKILNLNLNRKNKKWEDVGVFFQTIRSNANGYAHVRPKKPEEALAQLSICIESSDKLSKEMKICLQTEVSDANTLNDLKEYYKEREREAKKKSIN